MIQQRSLNPQQQPGAHSSPTAQTPSQTALKHEKGKLIIRRRARCGSYLGEWLAGLVLLPFGGVGMLVWLYFIADWLFTIYEIYEKIVVVRSGVFNRTTIFVRYFHVEDIHLVRDFFDLISGNARIIMLLDARKEEVGKIHGFSESSTPEGSPDTGPKKNKVVLRGLGNSQEMNLLCERLVVAVAIAREITPRLSR